MSWGYMFFSPARLPLAPADLSEATVRSFTDVELVRAELSARLTKLAWDAKPRSGLATGAVTEEGATYEFGIMRHEPPREADAPGDAEPVLIVKLRCSGRIDSAPFAQRLCDATGWIAFDDRAYLFQPHRPPVPAGSG